MKRGILLKLTLLLTSMMTMMAGAVVAPSLPQINAQFSHLPNAALLTRLVITLPALFIAAFSPLYGLLIDKYGRRRWLLFALVLYNIAGTSGAVLDDLYLILVGRAVLGVAVAGIMTAAVTLVGDYFEGEERSGFMGLQGAFVGIGGVFFITVAGWFADLHWQAPFLIYTFAVPVLVLAVLFLPEPTRAAVSTPRASGAAAYPKLKVFGVYGIVFVGIVFFYMIPVQVPFLVSALGKSTNAMAGYAISAATFASSMVSINYRRIKRHFSFPGVIALAFVLMGLGYAGLSFGATYPAYLAALALSGTGLGLLMPSGNLWLISLSPPSLRGRIIGRGSTAMFLGMFLSPIIVQPVVAVTSTAFSFRVAGGVLLLLAGVLALFRRRMA